MAFAPSSPVTGAAQTGLTSPTYTLSADTVPSNGKAYAVTALGGTQTGVTTHSASSPFTITMWRPQVLKTLGMPNPVTGVIPQVPMNVYKVQCVKGVLPLAGQPVRKAFATLVIEVPAGSDIADTLSIRAMLSCLMGTVDQIPSAIGDTAVTGVL